MQLKRRNRGFSSAYDSVFHGASADDVDAARERTNRRGKVVKLSKKERAREEALEATLR